jgi:hypothetical protein
MNSRYLSGVFLISLALASPAAADVTMKQKTAGKGMVAMSGESTLYLKGAKMRTDQTVGGSNKSTILDASSRQMIVLDHDKKEADIVDMTKIADGLSKIGVGDVKTSITPTAQTRQVAGATCTVYDVKIAAPMSAGKAPMTMVMAGPYCLVKNAPGQADFSAFAKAVAENGLFMDPNQAKAQPGLAKGMAEMHRKMSELGVPYSSEMNVSIEASGPMADMMKKANNTMTTEVTSVTTAAIPDSMFEIPAGYKVNKR